MKFIRLLNPILPILTIIENRRLIIQLTSRGFQSRYKGSFLGIFWSILTPLLMLVIYTFVFSEVFKIRWGEFDDNKVAFAVIMFCGMAVFNIFGESLNSSAVVITSNINFVKKIVFPLEILPIVQTITSFLFGIVSLFIIFIGSFIINGTLYWTSLLLPLVLIPLFFSCCAFGLLFSSFGVYFKDVPHFLALMLQILFFMTPIFYPIKAVPEKFRMYLEINPMSSVIENVRSIIIYGKLPDFNQTFIAIIVSYIVFWFCYIWFMKTKRGFADVL